MHRAPIISPASWTIVDLAFRMFLLNHIPRWQVIKNPLAKLMCNREVLVAAAVVAMVGWAWSGAIEPFLPQRLVHDFHASAASIGFIFTLSSVAYALVTALVDRMEELKGLADHRSGRDHDRAGHAVVHHRAEPVFGWRHLVRRQHRLRLCGESDAGRAGGHRWIGLCAGAYASVYAIFNIAYSIGTIGGDVATGR